MDIESPTAGFKQMTITLNSIDKTLVFFSERYKSTTTKLKILG